MGQHNQGVHINNQGDMVRHNPIGLQAGMNLGRVLLCGSNEQMVSVSEEQSRRSTQPSVNIFMEWNFHP